MPRSRSRKDEVWTLEEELKIRPHWKDVLLAVYNDEAIGREWGWGKTSIMDNHPLAKKLKISGAELMHSLAFLENQKLIQYGPERNWFTLTEKGFDVAVKIEGQRETFRYRKGSLYLSGILVLTTSTALVHQMIAVDPVLLLALYLIVLVIFEIVVWWEK
jgi:hypothetical protein